MQTRRFPNLGILLRRTLGVLAVAVLATPCLAQPEMLLADDSRPAHIQVSWPTRDGKTITLEGERSYKSAAQKAPLGKNLDCWVALGGTRLNKGLGNKDGAGVLVGLSKIDPKKPLFDEIADKATVTITLDHIFMNQPVEPRPKTVLMHLRYLLEHLHACGLTGEASSLYNTADPQDPLKDHLAAINMRLGVLDGQAEDHGKVEAKAETDGSVSLTVHFPYALLRHTQDPYQRTNPGGFFEPVQFHVEMEVVPKLPAASDPPVHSTEPKKPDAPK